MSYRLGQLKLGEILDQAIALTRDHFGLLFAIVLVIMIPFNIVAGVVNLSLMPELPPQPTAEDIEAFQIEQIKILPYTLSIGVVAGLVVMPLTSAALIWAIAQVYLGKTATVGSAFRQSFKRYWPFLGTSILMYLAIMVGIFMCVIPGIILALFFGLSQYIVMIENVAGVAALKRSMQLVRAQLGMYFVLSAVLFVIFAGLGLAGQLIPQIHVRTVVVTFINGAATILATAAGVVFYYSCRCSEENFDLYYLADAIRADAGESGESAVLPGV